MGNPKITSYPQGIGCYLKANIFAQKRGIMEPHRPLLDVIYGLPKGSPTLNVHIYA